MHVIKTFLQVRRQRHRKAKQLVLSCTVNSGGQSIEYWAEMLGREGWRRKLGFPKLPTQTQATQQHRG